MHLARASRGLDPRGHDAPRRRQGGPPGSAPLVPEPPARQAGAPARSAESPTAIPEEFEERARAGTGARGRAEARAGRERLREPRHVRAIPTSAEHKIASAVELFNGSEHRRTIAGVARSLGAPTVSVRPAEDGLSLVNVVASWELCWYRYEVDLSEEVPTVRLSAQGYELDELAVEERSGNAVSDERGSLSLSA